MRRIAWGKTFWRRNDHGRNGLGTKQPHNSQILNATGNMASSFEEPEFPCGSCKQNVEDNHDAVQCDACSQWFHAHCQNISAPQYVAYASLQSFSWLCLECGSPNYSSLPSGSLTSLTISNMYSILDAQILTMTLTLMLHYTHQTILDPLKAASVQAAAVKCPLHQPLLK